MCVCVCVSAVIIMKKVEQQSFLRWVFHLSLGKTELVSALQSYCRQLVDCRLTVSNEEENLYSVTGKMIVYGGNILNSLYILKVS